MREVLILGGGLAGLSCSYHLGHHNCRIIERNSYLGGHATTHKRDGAFWDEGPHVSFTKNSYVRNLLTWSADCDVLEYPTNVSNYFQGHWIPHPAQSHLKSVPEPLAGKCLGDFQRIQQLGLEVPELSNYQQWLDQAFGFTFSRTFPHAYTRKYWTCDPICMDIDWVGSRVFKPDMETVLSGYEGTPKCNTHYISSVRYPASGGFSSFIRRIGQGAQVFHDEVISINLQSKLVYLSGGSTLCYDSLISTIPLDLLVSLLENTPQEVKAAAACLRCSSLLLINILGTQSAPIPHHWLYVYDETKYSTRITQTHLLSPANTPSGMAGIQVEVYASPYRPFTEGFEVIMDQVCKEVLDMGLLDTISSSHFRHIQYANVIYDLNRRSAQNVILSFLAEYGLVREIDDLEPTSDWSNCYNLISNPELVLAGRFGQWKYFWSDDCIMRGERVSKFFDLS